MVKEHALSKAGLQKTTTNLKLESQYLLKVKAICYCLVLNTAENKAWNEHCKSFTAMGSLPIRYSQSPSNTERMRQACFLELAMANINPRQNLYRMNF
jgi:hypothetical protein